MYCINRYRNYGLKAIFVGPKHNPPGLCKMKFCYHADASAKDSKVEIMLTTYYCACFL